MRKLTRQQVIIELREYGYELDEAENYVNTKTRMRVFDKYAQKYFRLNLDQIRYRVKRGRARYNFLDDMMLEPASTEEETHPRNSFDRFVAKQNDEFKTKDTVYQQTAYATYKSVMPMISRQKQRTFTFTERLESIAQLNGVMIALRESLPKIDSDVKLTIVSNENQTTYAYINSTTYHALDQLFSPERDSISDSNDAVIEDVMYIKTISFEYVPHVESRRRRAGFFPYLNKSSFDLSRYGVYRSIDEIPDEPCFITAMIHSLLFTIDEINMISSFTKTRAIALTDLTEISNLLKTNIYVRLFSEIDQLSKKTSFIDVGKEYSKRFTLNVVHNHFYLQEQTDYSSFYIKNRERVDGDKRMANHQRKLLTNKLTDSSYGFAKNGVSSQQLLSLLMNDFAPISDENLQQLSWRSCRQSDAVKPFNASRPLIVKPPAEKSWKGFIKRKQGKRFFGYDIAAEEEEERESRLNELQQFVSSLPLRNYVDVRSYYAFSELMQRIMFEYGCFDGVYELSGLIRDKIREECSFPIMGAATDEKDFNEKLYYIDLNAAYMFAVDSIPTGLPNENGEFSGENKRVKDLIEIFYQARTKAKRDGNEKLAKTLKFLMNSSWGYSIKKSKDIIRTHTTNVSGTMREFGDLILSTDDQGKISRIKTFSPWFNYPQFARDVLSKFNARMKSIAEIVDVLYYNIDAIVIRERDYEKLRELGYMDDSKMGYFKIEHVFSELHILSKKKWYGKLDDGTTIRHCC